MLILALGLGALGVWNYAQLPIDAVPDITNVQVMNTTPGYSPLEAEQRLSYPIETALAGLPHRAERRSIARYGLSQTTVVFEDGTDVYFARQQVTERLKEVGMQLPAGIQPTLGPVATGLGEIFMYMVEAEPGRAVPTASHGRRRTCVRCRTG
ncbi:Metal transporter OS=Rhodanobacter lindaniclasticus OX=75310 GN=B1991_08780 PE=3 SV=1 [Rhodanobacter lindaniclasticus]